MVGICSVRYDLHQKLGEGSFAVVWKGKLAGSAEDVALKVFKSKLACWCKMEKKICERIGTHPAIVKFLGSVGTEKYPVLAFEYLPFTNLYELCAQRGHVLKLDVAHSVFIQLGQGYDYLHSNGIIHCDGKSENFLWGRRNGQSVAKIIDFNHAYKAGVSQKLRLVQTVFYRAPEVVHQVEYTDNIDMWSLACTIHEVLTCEILFELDSLCETTEEAKKLCLLHMHAIGCLPPETFRKMTVYPYTKPMPKPESKLTNLEEQYKQENDDDLALLFAKVVRASITWRSISAKEFLAILNGDKSCQ